MNFPWPPSLTIDNARVLHLFTGENFYSDCDAALREAVLNAIDAITRRQANDSNVKPDIKVLFSETEQCVSISDNGDGMDDEAIATLFTRVGASASRFVARAGGGPTSAIGEFGIGALSYFLVSDEYLLNSVKAGRDPVGLKLSAAMLDGASTAEPVVCNRSEIGTTLTLIIKKPEIFARLRERFAYWFRSVEGLTATDADTGVPIPQGGLTKAIRQVSGLNTPEWIDRAEIGPPQDLSLLSGFDGKGRVDVLYRGVFVERLEVDHLWGIEGAVHVDPKHFRPKLNREGFVGQHLRAELEPVLRSYHPSALKELVLGIRGLLADKQKWSEFRAISLWLAVPRGQEYTEAAALWDKEFRSYKAFRLLSADDDTEVSIDDIVALNAPMLHVAPDRIDPSSLVAQAVRVLRAQGCHILQGVRREDGFMSSASFHSTSSAWLLSAFENELPPRTDVQAVVDETLSKESLADIYSTPVAVRAMKLGRDSAPFVTVKGEVWINIESEAGKSIVSDVCARNQGHLGLWTACMLHAPDNANNLNGVASLLRRAAGMPEHLGLVRRQYLRSLLA
ncbi:hypothetical protein V1278_001872 [Bradyrhizobium sp. AZCC 1577]|uniref:ATP-binding protein n=1 Tax=Bradyrhizobium sp. AZCC 1577 TaxID=3117019 RepID=UPI002FEEDC76